MTKIQSCVQENYARQAIVKDRPGANYTPLPTPNSHCVCEWGGETRKRLANSAHIAMIFLIDFVKKKRKEEENISFSFLLLLQVT